MQVLKLVASIVVLNRVINRLNGILLLQQNLLHQACLSGFISLQCRRKFQSRLQRSGGYQLLSLAWFNESNRGVFNE